MKLIHRREFIRLKSLEMDLAQQGVNMPDEGRIKVVGKVLRSAASSNATTPAR